MKSIRICGVWKHKDSKGGTYLQGKAGSFYIQIRKNDFKKGDNEPDYNVYFTQAEKKQPDEMLDGTDSFQEDDI